MGLLDLPAPILGAIDGVLAVALSPMLRLLVWGVLAGWLTMIVYRFFSDQKRIGALKNQQKTQQKNIAEFDGEFSELLPLIRRTLALGMKQLGLALGPALIATVPVLFIIIWVAGEFGHVSPAAGNEVVISVEPVDSDIHWSSATDAISSDSRWVVKWPSQGKTLTMIEGSQPLLVLPMAHNIPILHKEKWWNFLMANPLGYLPKDSETELVRIELPELVITEAGPAWMHGWMFSFFASFFLSSFGFKFLLRLN